MTPEIHDGPDESVHAQPGAHVQNVRFEVSERTLSILALALSTAAMVTALWSIHESDGAARETKQLQIQVMDHNALLLREGILKPTDETYGPAGNLEYRKGK
jgi:hypothetical protein